MEYNNLFKYQSSTNIDCNICHGMSPKKKTYVDDSCSN